MPDPISSVAAAVGLAQKLYHLSSKIRNVEAKSLIADLHNSLADANMQAAALKEENLRLTDELNALKRSRVPEVEMELRDGKYFIRQPRQGEYAGPFCINCFHQGGRKIPLVKAPNGFDAFGNWECKTCEKFYP
jgi:hypothetical protein